MNSRKQMGIRAIVAALFVCMGVAATGGTVAYWELDRTDGDSLDLTAAVGGSGMDLSQGGGNAVATSAVACENPIPNPDETPGFSDPAVNGANNGASAQWYADDRWLQTPATDAFKLSGRSWTFECWFQNDADVTGFGAIMAGTRNIKGGWHLRVASDGYVRAYFNDNYDEEFEIVADDDDYGDPAGDPFEWHHVALTWESGAGEHSNGHIELYVDGELKDSGSLPADFDVANTDANDEGRLYIGARPWSSGENAWRGRLDEVRFSDAVLEPIAFLNYVARGTSVVIR